MVSILTIGLVAAAALVFSRRFGGNPIPETDVLQEVTQKNLQLLENKLQFDLEDEPNRVLKALSQAQNQLSRLGSLESLAFARGGFKIELINAAKRRNAATIATRERLTSQISSLQLEKTGIFDTISNILTTQNQFNSASLSDIRQRLNSSEFST